MGDNGGNGSAGVMGLQTQLIEGVGPGAAGLLKPSPDGEGDLTAFRRAAQPAGGLGHRLQVPGGDLVHPKQAVIAVVEAPTVPGGGLAAAVPQPGVGEGGNAPDRFQVQLLQDPPPRAAPPD